MVWPNQTYVHQERIESVYYTMVQALFYILKKISYYGTREHSPSPRLQEFLDISHQSPPSLIILASNTR